jgi:ABC-2 type transport system ATP-binding protein
VTVFGQDAGSRPLRDRVGYVTQEASVYDDLSAPENLRFFAAVLGVGGDEVTRSLEAVDLAGLRDQVVGEMSGGERSRVSLAVALLTEPDLLVLDEPTVGLDPSSAATCGRCSTDRPRPARWCSSPATSWTRPERCDRLLLMREGAISADGSLDEIRRRAAAPDIEGAFLQVADEAARRRGASTGGA